MKLHTVTKIAVIVMVFATVSEVSEARGRRRRVRQNRCPRLKNPVNGKVRLRSRGRMAEFSCDSGFTLMGLRLSMCLKSGAWSQPDPICAGTGCPKLSLPDEVQVTKKNGGAQLQFQCANGLTRIGPETIFCNGRVWSEKPPECLTKLTNKCDFEGEYLCGWSNDALDDFDWTRISGKTPTSGTGPKTDHTTLTPQGHYLFIESSAPQRHGDKAKLLSPVFNPGQMEGICFDFYYHMFGPSDPAEVGILDLLVVPANSSTKEQQRQVFHEEGNQGDKWIRADIDIPKMDNPLQLVFQATRLRGWTSDIAIDDLRFYNCSERPPTTLPPTTTMTTTTFTPTTTTTTTPTTPTSTTTPTTTTTATTPTTSPPTIRLDTTTIAVPSSATKFTLPTASTSISSQFKSLETSTGAGNNDTFTDVSDSYDARRGENRTSTIAIVRTPVLSHKDGVSDNRTTLSDVIVTKGEDSKTATSTTEKPRGPLHIGKVKEQGNTNKTMQQQLPLIIGVAAGVFVLAVVVSLVAYTVSKKHRLKQQKKEQEEEDQLNIITEFVETNLNG